MKPAEPTRAICYARFSPRPGAATCESCESQLADLRCYCAAHGLTVAGEFDDKALSGGDDWSEREGMVAAVAACRRGMLFLVRSFDRLFRDTLKALAFEAMLAAKGVRVASSTEEGASLDTAEAQLMRTFFLGIATYQRRKIREATKAKMLLHQKNGRRMSKLPPYGMMIDPADPKRLVPNPKEQRVIVSIRGLSAEGWTFRSIANWLNKNGPPARARDGWTQTQIRRILARP